MDMIIHFDYAKKDQIIEIHKIFCPDDDSNEFYKQVKHLKLTPAILQSFLFQKKNLFSFHLILIKTFLPNYMHF